MNGVADPEVVDVVLPADPSEPPFSAVQAGWEVEARVDQPPAEQVGGAWAYRRGSRGVVLGGHGGVPGAEEGQFTVLWWNTGIETVEPAARWNVEIEPIELRNQLEIGDEIEALLTQKQSFAPDEHGNHVEIFRPGDRGRILDFVSDEDGPAGGADSAQVVWFRTGRCNMLKLHGWYVFVRWVAKAPVLGPGVELQVMPTNQKFSDDCKVIYAAGWRGRVTRVNMVGNFFCMRWYQGLEEQCHTFMGWMKHFAFLGEAVQLEVGDLIETLANVGKCTNLANESWKDERYQIRDPVGGGFLSRDIIGRAWNWGCGEGQQAIYEKSVRGRVGQVVSGQGQSQGMYCVTFYTGYSACEEDLDNWFTKFVLVGKALTLEEGYVLQALPFWERQGVYLGHDRGVITKADVHENELCVRWFRVNATFCEPMEKWEQRFIFISVTFEVAQKVANCSIGNEIEVYNTSQLTAEWGSVFNLGDRGQITIYRDEAAQFCAFWYTKQCCSCHHTSFLKSTTFLVLRTVPQKWMSDCKDISAITTQGHCAVAESGVSSGGMDSTIKVLLIVIFVLLALFCVCCAVHLRYSGQKDKQIREFEMVALPKEVEVPFISRARSTKAYPTRRKCVSGSKFDQDVPCLISGAPAAATTGLEKFLNVSRAKLVAKLHSEIDALRAEWLQRLGDEEDPEAAAKGLDLLRYVLDEPARQLEEMSNDGHSYVIRDEGNEGRTLADFAQIDEAVQSDLTIGEVAALRIYTSWLFRYINQPFRKSDNREGFLEEHPVGITVLLISSGLKKLRTLHAGRNDAVYFWRGMKDLTISEEFEFRGGTELQCMSTTADISVAGQYGQSQHPLIFCMHCRSFINRGADISWLSLYGHEKEILYPPLTYLKFLGRRKIKDSDGGFVVDVEPLLG